MPRSTSPTPMRLPLWLLGAFLVAAVLLGISPRDRQDWLLENAIVAAALPLLVFGWCRLRFSRGACLAMFAFLLLHEVGAHYTYSEVPYDRFFRTVCGHSPDALFGWHRNQFDRAVHLLYGILVTPMAAELLDRRTGARGIWRWILPVTFITSHSVLYELVEWMAAIRFGGDLGAAYLGAQGDPWDAQKDMALATLGSVISMTLLLVRRTAAARGTPPDS